MYVYVFNQSKTSQKQQAQETIFPEVVEQESLCTSAQLRAEHCQVEETTHNLLNKHR